jgi:hypothetical protein
MADIRDLLEKRQKAEGRRQKELPETTLFVAFVLPCALCLVPSTREIPLREVKR